jgi:lipopolysaccharide biosynthesis glycosyltransferase
MSNSKLIIACATDKKYAVLVATMLKSVELNHCNNGNTAQVFIINNNIGSKRKLNIQKSVDKKKIEITFIEVPKSLKSKLNIIPNSTHLTAYYRLFLPYILPEEIKKILYLDCDIIVLKDLTELWKTTLNTNEIVAAVQDKQAYTVDSNWGGAIDNWKELGFLAGDKYFNSGVLLIDLKKWMEEDITNKVIKITVKNYKYVKWLDQYGLNVALEGKWKELKHKFNSYPLCSVDHSILHFVSTKPHLPDYKGTKQEVFFKYLDLTKWAGKRPRSFKRIKTFIDKLYYRINLGLQPW